MLAARPIRPGPRAQHSQDFIGPPYLGLAVGCPWFPGGRGQLLIYPNNFGNVFRGEMIRTTEHGEWYFTGGGLSFKPALADTQDGGGFVQ